MTDVKLTPLPWSDVQPNGRRAALLEALRAADALAACCMAVDGYSRRELADMARATLPTFTAAIALAQGDAA